MMGELRAIQEAVQPSDTLLVVDAMTGQVQLGIDFLRVLDFFGGFGLLFSRFFKAFKSLGLLDMYQAYKFMT